jgi:hypothetical protein
MNVESISVIETIYSEDGNLSVTKETIINIFIFDDECSIKAEYEESQYKNVDNSIYSRLLMT